MSFLRTSVVCMLVLAFPRVSEAEIPELPFAGFSVKRETSIVSERDRAIGVGSVSGLFNANTMFLAEQLQKNANEDVRGVETVVSTIMDINNLEASSPLGRLLGEHLAHHLSLRGWTIVESKLVRELIFTDGGEFGMTRSDFRKPVAMRARNLVTGTYAVTKDGILVTIKMIDTGSGRLLSSAQTRILKDKFSADLVIPSVVSTGTTVTVTP